MISKELLSEIEEFCEVNELKVSDIVNEALRGGFTTVKFGATPISAKNQIKTVEIIKEIIKEVEVEKIVEVIIEKEVKVSDDTKVNELLDKINYLTEETDSMANILLIRDNTITKLSNELEECKNNNKLDLYGE